MHVPRALQLKVHLLPLLCTAILIEWPALCLRQDRILSTKLVGSLRERGAGKEGAGGVLVGADRQGVSVAHMVCLCTGRHASTHAFVCACAHIFVHEYKAACTCVDTIMQIRPLARMIC